MSGRDMDAATYAALGDEVLYPAWAVYLDILDDPVQVWTGIGPFVASSTGDPVMDGKTFDGIADIGQISAIVDGPDGSQTVTLALPGVDLSDTALNQVVNNSNRWQFRAAHIWLITLGSSGVMVGQPVRVKSGRMSLMTCTDSNQGSSTSIGGELDGTVMVEVESHQAYASEALSTRWSEQQELDPTDLSQIYVWDLANKVASLGDKTLASENTSTMFGVLATASYGRN